MKKSGLKKVGWGIKPINKSKLLANLAFAAPSLGACQNQTRLADPVVYYASPDGKPSQVSQSLILPGILTPNLAAQSRISPGDTLFAATGRKLYVLGDIDGGFRPRTNPYDLYNFGKPLPDDPLANKLQGVWAQPVKALNGYTFEVEMGGSTWTLWDAHSFTQDFVEAKFSFQQGNLAAIRRDFIPQDQPLLLTTLTLKNQGSHALDLKVRFKAFFDLEDAWFTSLANSRNQGETVSLQGERLVAQSLSAPDAWAVAVGSSVSGADVTILNPPGQHPQGQFEYPLNLPPGTENSWTFGVAVDSQSGSLAALKTLDEGFKQGREWLAQKRSLYACLLQAGPHLRSPDPDLNLAFEVAKANLLMLEAESPALGPYFYAGLQTFPFWFSVDLAYSTPGLAAAGLVDPLKNALLTGIKINMDGRIPHQISPSGRISWPGNAQETPQWVMAVWDYYRWTGDRDFLVKAYPTALKGLLEYTLTQIDYDGDDFPSGAGIVEQGGMGAEKLDATAYTWAALNALEKMAGVMGDAQTATLAQARISRIKATFDGAWWDAAGGTYAMSLNESDNSRLPVPHWAVITPLEVGLATPEHTRATFDTIEAIYLNSWGLKHTAGQDERVWTLPTATLSRAAFRSHRPELGLQMLAHVAQTLDSGSIGLFHELIPDGLCTVQLWSGATFIRGVVEDLLGIDVNAAEGALSVSPQLPAGYGPVNLENLSFGPYTVDVSASTSEIKVHYISGSGMLDLTLRLPSGAAKEFKLHPGETIQLSG